MKTLHLESRSGAKSGRSATVPGICATLALAACSQGGLGPGGRADAGDITEILPGTVVAPTAIGTANIPECRLPFYPPTGMTIVRRSGSWTCKSWAGGSDSCSANTSQIVIYSDEVVDASLTFAPELAGHYSESAFQTYFRGGAIAVTIPPPPTDHSELRGSPPTIAAFSAPDGLSYSNGRLRMVLHSAVVEANQEVRTAEPTCTRGGDDLNTAPCHCYYERLSIPVSIDIDAPFPE